MSVLIQHNHILARALLTTFHSFNEVAASSSSDVISTRTEEMCTLIIKLHNDPGHLFLSCFSIELTHIKHLAAVMRERSVSVRALQHLWRSYDMSLITDPFVRFVRKLTTQKLKLLTEPDTTPSKAQKRLKHKLLNCLSTFFTNAHVIPPLICALCHHCAELITTAQSEETNNSPRHYQHWAVDSLIFLRGVVPAITALSAMPEATESERKGFVLIGKFVMKLCCNSQFDPGSPLNDVISDAFPLFDKFCTSVMEIGNLNQKLLHHTKELTHIADDGVSGLYDFLCMISADVTSNLEKLIESEGVDVDANALFQRFKNELSLSLVDACPFAHTPRTTKEKGVKHK